MDTIRFTPDSLGARNAFILIASNDAPSPDTVSMGGSGVGTVVLFLNQPSITFPTVKLGQWKDTTVTITNMGTDTLKIKSITSTKSYFGVRPTALTIAPGQSKADTIRLTPDSIGVRSGLLLFASNDAMSPDTVAVSGNGWTTRITQFGNEIPTAFILYQNYPNPFNPTTAISFSLPYKSFVSLKVFDRLGREVSVVLSEELPAGGYSRQWNALGLPSGMYFYRLQAGSFTETKKLLLLR
jgi:hypothetical protein